MGTGTGRVPVQFHFVVERNGSERIPWDLVSNFLTSKNQSVRKTMTEIIVQLDEENLELDKIWDEAQEALAAYAKDQEWGVERFRKLEEELDALRRKDQDMPRENEKPLPCKSCRFADLDRQWCERNPPDNGRPADIRRYLQEGRGCYAGEPIKEKSQPKLENRPGTYGDARRCENCKHHKEDWKSNNLLFQCLFHKFDHQDEIEMNTSTCGDWEEE
jgi:hypothetical protein